MGDLQRTIDNIRQRLLAARDARGFWHGRLSSSALSTATASIALALVDAKTHKPLISRGLDWLAAHANADGGWGDTVRSRSNINTTCLCWSALAFAPREKKEWLAAAAAAEVWVRRHTGAVDAEKIVDTILRFYGDDRTFSTPVLTLLALSGRLGPRQEAFRRIPQLPFELAAAPQGMWRLLRLPVVSYALPALVAIGQARHHHVGARGPLALFRRVLKKRTLDVVRRMQPTSGGFLEAIPLTSFVCACLASMGMQQHSVTRDAVRFLLGQVREDHAWPIDTCLSTWLTSLSVHALAARGALGEWLTPAQRKATVEWLLKQQYTYVHPFTNTPPGGWSWMDTDGAVPDADDTPGAILALAELAGDDPAVRAAIERGVAWLLDLQNRDGGIPTFCRGWGKLPFDRSAADISAHTLRAWARAKDIVSPAVAQRIGPALQRVGDYLRRTQRADGSWLPLWFGNQFGDDDTNPCYGTGKVVKGLCDAGMAQRPETIRGVQFLLETQRRDGGWSGGNGPAGIEETSVALEALASWLPHATDATLAPRVHHALLAGAEWIVQTTAEGTHFVAAPIGLYFAKLWYYEELYPLVYTLAALEQVQCTACGLPGPCAQFQR